MTFAPPRLLEWRSHMQGWTGLAPAQLGIVGGPGHILTGTSYHLGADQLKMYKNPYSARHPRDVAGLTNAASACDTGWFARLVALTAWAVAEARAGRRPDTRELIGPGGDGRAYRWAAENGWSAELRPDGDDHESHLHESFFRDSEHRDKVGLYRPFFQGDEMLTHLEKVMLGNAEHYLQSLFGLTDKAVMISDTVNVRDLPSAFTPAFKKLAADVAALRAAADADQTRDAAMTAAIEALAELVRAGGGDPDTAAILTRIDERTAQVRADVEQRHQAEMAELRRDRDAQIAALQAELTRLASPAEGA